MKSADLINELAKSQSYGSLLHIKQIQEHNIRDLIRDHFPRLGLTDKLNLEPYLSDQVLFEKMQRLFEAHQQIFSRIESIQQQLQHKTRNPSEDGLTAGKKVTRAALARRLQKNQEEIRKDQIFVRLTPKSQTCIQFMLCNRNFPRMEVKLSCNQHLEYLVNYLTNKWIRGKVGFKIVLFPDNSFLKAMPITEKEKALKEPLNNYLMFTDVMTCCGVHQNGVLNLCYEIVEVKKLVKQAVQPGTGSTNNAEVVSVEASQSIPIHQGSTKQPQREKSKQIGVNTVQISSPLDEESSKGVEKPLPPAIKLTTPSKFGMKDDYMKEASMFNRNSNFYNNNEESLFGSLGFNFNFGATPAKRDEHLLSINSINYMDAHFHQTRRLFEKEKDPGCHAKEDKVGLTEIKVEEVEEGSDRSNGAERELKKESSQERESQQNRALKEDVVPQDIKLDTLMSYLERIQKEKQKEKSVAVLPPPDESQNNNSNKIKDVKLVNIVKKRTNPL